MTRPPGGFTELWCIELGSLAGLAGLRARVRAASTGRSDAPDPDVDEWPPAAPVGATPCRAM